MKYWKKPNGDCGTVDNKGFVPNSIEVLKEEYDDYIKNYPVVIHVETDIEKIIKYAKKKKWIE